MIFLHGTIQFNLEYVYFYVLKVIFKIFKIKIFFYFKLIFFWYF